MGRPKGSRNTFNEVTRARIAREGELPLDYMLRVMRDNRSTQARRDAMAIAAAPYLHARLQAIRHSGDPDNPVRRVDRIERVMYDATTGSMITFQEQPNGDVVEARAIIEPPPQVERDVIEGEYQDATAGK